jgi:hypothetical protein
MSEPVLTLFSTPKPFLDPHVVIIQRNAIQSWKQMGNKVEIVLIGDDYGVSSAAKELGVKLIPDVRRNKEGTPLLSSIFDLARLVNHSPLMGVINTDIIVFPEFITTCEMISQKTDKFVLAGQRWDLKIEKLIQFKKGWETSLRADIKTHGRRHPPAGSDYFVFPRSCYSSIPDFAIGRAGWDNWMIFKARREHWKMIDASNAIAVVHQDHDYGHLPKGKTHHKIPETFENIRLAGGKRAIFSLADADYSLKDSQITRAKANWKRICRGIETWPLVYLHSFFLADISFGLLHPIKAHQERRARQLNTDKTHSKE